MMKKEEKPRSAQSELVGAIPSIIYKVTAF